MTRIFLTLFMFFVQVCFAEYYSQCGQDKLVQDLFFGQKENGIFIDIGAHNGISLSNTYFFEKEKNWKGICIEPMPLRFAELCANRKCICVEGCVSDFKGDSQLLLVTSPNMATEMLSGLLHKYDPRHLERVIREISYYGGSYQLIDVKCFLLNDLLKKHNLYHVDFLSIDTEGGEFDIIQSINFSKFKIDVIVLEDNYGDERFVSFLNKKGYRLAERLPFDLVFVRKDFKPGQS